MKQSKFIIYRCLGETCAESKTLYSWVEATNEANKLARANPGITYKVMEHVVQEVYRIISTP